MIKQWFITHGQSSDPTAHDSSIRHWLLDHGYDDNEPTFDEDFESLKKLIFGIIDLGNEKKVPMYDDMYGDNKECLCGHPYYRHFDTYDNMDPVGCKYCSHWGHENDAFGEYHGEGHCTGFKEKPIVQPAYQSQSMANFQCDEYCTRRVGCTCPDCLAPGYGGFKP